jgi:abscisic-aldehyde oxidase
MGLDENRIPPPPPWIRRRRLAAAVNGERFELRRNGGDPGESLLEFLRSRTRFTGAKLGCGEGKATQTISPSSSAALLPFDRLRQASLMVSRFWYFYRWLRACVVVVSAYDAEVDEVTHAAVNSCLTLVHGLHHRAVTTTEGLGSSRRGKQIASISTSSRMKSTGNWMD